MMTTDSLLTILRARLTMVRQRLVELRTSDPLDIADAVAMDTEMALLYEEQLFLAGLIDQVESDGVGDETEKPNNNTGG